jgi:hypothetical protein
MLPEPDLDRDNDLLWNAIVTAIITKHKHGSSHSTLLIRIRTGILYKDPSIVIIIPRALLKRCLGLSHFPILNTSHKKLS